MLNLTLVPPHLASINQHDKKKQLVQLVTATICNNATGVNNNMIGGGIRRSLTANFEENNDSASPPKRIKLEFQHQLPQQQQSATAPNHTTVQGLPITALKSLISYVEAPNKANNQQQQQHQQQHKVLSGPKIQVVSSETQAALLKAAAAVASATGHQHKIHFSDVNSGKQAYRPLLISNTLPLNNKANGTATGNVFQIIPIQCKPLKTTVSQDKSIHAVPLMLSPQSQQHQVGGRIATSFATTQAGNNVLTMLMRQPLVTVNSPTVILSPRNQILKKTTSPTSTPTGGVQQSPVAEMLTTQQIVEKYPEYFTPPHNGMTIGKPGANPIIFPKMTPETPSSEPKGTLNAVTRKLMSFQNEEKEQALSDA